MHGPDIQVIITPGVDTFLLPGRMHNGGAKGIRLGHGQLEFVQEVTGPEGVVVRVTVDVDVASGKMSVTKSIF